MGRTSTSGSLDFDTRIKRAGGVKIIANMPYARNQWAIMKDFSTLPSRDGTYRTLTRYQQLFILEEKKIDIEEMKRAIKGVDPDNAKQFYDNETSWWDDPEHHDLFEDDPQTDEELSKALDKFVDSETKAKVDAKVQALKDSEKEPNGVDEVQEEINRRKAMVNQLVEDPNKLTKYRKALREKKEYTPDEEDEAPEVDTSKQTDEQKRLAKLALENTMKAIHGGNI